MINSKIKKITKAQQRRFITDNVVKIKTDNVVNVGNLPYDSPKLVCPIPLGEINTNPLIKQNPGY